MPFDSFDHGVIARLRLVAGREHAVIVEEAHETVQRQGGGCLALSKSQKH